MRATVPTSSMPDAGAGSGARPWASAPAPASWRGRTSATSTRSSRATAPAPDSCPTTSSRPPTAASTRSCPPIGGAPLRERYIAWREAHAVPAEKLEPAIRSLADDLRERTQRLFGLPDGEHVEWIFETDKPWSGFNYYEGGLRSRVAINLDLPVLSLTLGHLVAHEAYPGHHTEHTRKEVGLVRQRRWLEETIFLVGTPQCTMAEGLADLGVEVVVGRRPEPVVAEHLRPLGIRYDAEVAAAVAESAEALSWVRSNAAVHLHDGGWPVEDVVAYLERWALLPRNRAEKAVSFLTDPTWRAYSHCYTEGLRLCRGYVDGDPARFERLVTDQLLPADLATAAA